MRPLIIVPTYNERSNVDPLLERIMRAMGHTDVLIVDDSSPDGTAEAAESWRERGFPVTVLRRTARAGLGSAYVAGMKYALSRDYDVIIQMDADLSHDPYSLPVFLEQIKGFDVVIGSRYMNGTRVTNWDPKRVLLSRLANKYVKFITRMPFTDATGGFNCWRREALQGINFEHVFSDGYLFQIELKYKTYIKNFRMAEIPITFAERREGQSKLNLHIIWEAVWGVWKLRLGHQLW